MDQGTPHKIRDTDTDRGESGEEPQRHGHREKFLNRTPMACSVRSRINKWDFIKLQSFCKAKDSVNKTKWQPTDWKKIFTDPTSHRWLTINICKVLKKLDSREPNNPIFKMGNKAKQRILNWRNLNGWEAPKEIFNILSQEGNANQNNPEIPPHTNQNG